MISLRSRIAIWLTLSALLWVGIIALGVRAIEVAGWAVAMLLKAVS